MNKRRLSYGLLLTLAGAMMAACGDPTPEVAPQPSATAPVETAAPAPEPAPPPAVTAAPEPPPPPAKPSREKFVGKFVQDFSGDVKDAADAAAKKSAGKKDPDNKKYNAAMDKAGKAVADYTIETTTDKLVWSKAGKAAHTIDYKVAKGDDPSSLTINLGKDGKKDLKGLEVSVSFSDDNTFSMKDPFAKKDPKTLVFKRQ